MDALAVDIEALGHQVWLDRKLTGGQVWWNHILEEIRLCDALVFALTRNSVDSAACMAEGSYAVALGKPILPVQVADGITDNLLPNWLAQIQIVDYRQQDRAAGLALAKALAALPLPAPAPDPLPTPPPVPMSRLNAITERLADEQSLSLEDQRSVLFELERDHRVSKTRSDARALLLKLRSRQDVYSDVAEAIDSLTSGAAKWSWRKRITLTMSVTLGAALIGVLASVFPKTDGVSGDPPHETTTTTPVDPWVGVPDVLKGALGDPDSRASFDFDGDGTNEDCRIVSGTPSYFLCSSQRNVFYGEIDQPGLRDWPREWVDWDGDGKNDWCRIVGATRGAKFLRCSFSNGKTLNPTATSDQIDVGYGFSGPHRSPVFERRSGVMQYCRITGSFDFEENRPCLPAKGRGFGADVPGKP